MKKKSWLIIMVLFLSCEEQFPIVSDFEIKFSGPEKDQLLVKTENKEQNIPSIESVNNKIGSSEVLKIRTLSIATVELKSLKGIDEWSNLKILEFEYNQIKSIDLLSSLKNLSVIVGYSNKIPNLESLGNLKKLIEIDFHKNLVSEFPKFLDLPLLKVVNLSDNQIEYLDPFNKLTALKKLTINRNRIKKIDFLPSGLEYLKAEENPITDISGIQGEKIFFLNLSKSKLTKIPSLKGLPNMKEIFFDGTPSIQDYSGLSDLKELVILHLEDCGLEDVSKLPTMASVRGLYLTKNRIREIPPILEKFPSLAVLYLDGNQIEKVSGMKRFFEGAFQNWSLKDNPVKSIVKEDWQTYLKSLNGQESEISQAVKEGKIQVVEN